jgi:cytochrome P450
MSFGVTQRLSRIDPLKPVHYGNWTIPPGTIFGMSSYMMHRDPSIFPRPDVFDPTRWLNNPRSCTGKPLNRYLVPFGRGPRMCLGLNLAYAELHMGLATLFRQLKLKLYETDRSDVDIAADYFVPMPREGSKGVRVTVE